jgi:hypothetical protein
MSLRNSELIIPRSQRVNALAEDRKKRDLEKIKASLEVKRKRRIPLTTKKDATNKNS